MQFILYIIRRSSFYLNQLYILGTYLDILYPCRFAKRKRNPAGDGNPALQIVTNFRCHDLFLCEYYEKFNFL